MHWVYILRCADDALYIGQTGDLEHRILLHDKGLTRFTFSRLPVTMVYSETVVPPTRRDNENVS